MHYLVLYMCDLETKWIEGWVTLPQYCKVLLQGHVALESHGLAARARLARTKSLHRTSCIGL